MSTEPEEMEVSSPQNVPNPPAARSRGVKHSSESENQIKRALLHLPRVTETEFRLAVEDITDALSKKRGFEFRVAVETTLMLALAGSVVLGIIGYSVNTLYE